MKLKKKRKKDTIYKLNLKKSLLILIMLICIIVAMITYWIYAYQHKYGNIYNNDINLISYKISDYLEIKGNMVYLKNIDEQIINNFTSSQQSILLDNEVLHTDISKELHKDILSVMISYTMITNDEKLLVLNVDLRNNKLISDEELLNKIGSSYKQIAENIYDEFIKLPSDYSGDVTDTITDTKMTAKEFNNNSEKYIIRVREKLPDIIKLYIKDNKLNYNINLAEIYKVCYYTNTNKLVNINKELGQI